MPTPNEYHNVTLFTPYCFSPGQKIRIASGSRKGDWLVLAADDDAVTLRCPVSLREFTWKNFCYLVEEEVVRPWPDLNSVEQPTKLHE